MSVAAILGILFVGLKLAHIIAWSWWLVTLPFYAGAALSVAVALVIGSAFTAATVAGIAP